MADESMANEISALRALLLRTHYFEEARWLDTAVASPDFCFGEQARSSLHRVQTVAREFGFAAVAKWLADGPLH
jgi:hypothetical protein